VPPRAIGGSLLYVIRCVGRTSPFLRRTAASNSRQYKDAVEEYEALARSGVAGSSSITSTAHDASDPESEGQTYIIIAFKDTPVAPPNDWYSTYVVIPR